MDTVEEITIEKKSNRRINWYKALEYSLPSIITVVIFVIAMIVKGVYPFGSESVGYIDFNDGLVPAYTALWDVLHGKMNLFVSWDLGAGGSFIASAILNSFLSPICWIVAIFPRDMVIYSVALVLIIMLALMALTAYICFRRFFPNVNKVWLLLFSLLWTFSGWTLVHYTNIGWLNIMILLPLLLISAKKLVAESKNLWFVVILTYMLMLSYYITYMVLVGVVVVATLYICILAKEKKKVASNLFFAIIISILISFVAFIPSCFTSLQAHRFSGTAVGNPQTELFSHFFSKLIVIIMYALPVVFFVRLMMSYKKDNKVVLFYILSFAICTIGLIIEPINQMWHTGSYYCFPYRYSFIIIFIMIFGSLYYLNNHYKGRDNIRLNTSKINWVNICIGATALCSAILILICSLFGSSVIPYRETGFPVFLMYFFAFAFMYLFIELSLRLGSKRLALGGVTGGALIFVACIIQILALTIGYCSGIMGYDTNVERVNNAYEIQVKSLDQGYKIKDRENLYNNNFPYLIEYPSMSTWIHISSEDQFVAYNNLGYNTQSTVLRSSGGTIISDVLLGNKYVLSREKLDSRYYKEIDSFDFIEDVDNKKVDGVVYLYELNFNMDLVYTTNADLSNLITNSDDWFYNHNILFRSLYNQSRDIITKIEYSFEILDDTAKITVNAPIGANVYMQNAMTDSLNVTYNGFAYDIYNGISDFGISNGETMEIIVDLEDVDAEKLQSSIEFGSMDIALFQSIHNSIEPNNASKLSINGNSINVEINNTTSAKYALIPYTYLDNMTAVINDTDCDVMKAFGSFIMVEINKGENTISVTYQPQLFNVCLIVTLVAIALFVVFAILNRRFNIAGNKVVVWIGFVGACVILTVVGVLVFIKPFINFFVTLFS